MKFNSFELQSSFKTLPHRGWLCAPLLGPPSSSTGTQKDGPSSWHCSLSCSLLQGINQQPPLWHILKNKKSILHHLLGRVLANKSSCRNEPRHERREASRRGSHHLASSLSTAQAQGLVSCEVRVQVCEGR